VLIDRSRDARSESVDASEYVTSTGVGKSDRSQEVRQELGSTAGVGHTTEVVHMTGVVIYLHYNHV
jgi:hypothetical protein